MVDAATMSCMCSLILTESSWDPAPRASSGHQSFRVDRAFGDLMPQEQPHLMTYGSWRINSLSSWPLSWEKSEVCPTQSPKGSPMGLSARCPQ